MVGDKTGIRSRRASTKPASSDRGRSLLKRKNQSTVKTLATAHVHTHTHTSGMRHKARMYPVRVDCALLGRRELPNSPRTRQSEASTHSTRLRLRSHGTRHVRSTIVCRIYTLHGCRGRWLWILANRYTYTNGGTHTHTRTGSHRGKALLYWRIALQPSDERGRHVVHYGIRLRLRLDWRVCAVGYDSFTVHVRALFSLLSLSLSLLLQALAQAPLHPPLTKPVRLCARGAYFDVRKCLWSHLGSDPPITYTPRPP